MRVTQAAWDAGSFLAARYAHRAPTLTRAAALAAEVVQRPRRGELFADGEVRLVYRGNDRQLFHTIASTFRAEPTTARPSEVDVHLEEIPWFARSPGALVLPRWVGLRIDLETPERERRRRSLLQSIRARGLTFEIASGALEADELYDRFYVPTARARHGDLAFTRRRGYVRRAASAGHVLFVRAPHRVAAMLLVPRDGQTIDAWISGVLDGDYARGDAVERDALYVFAAKWAKSRGARYLGLTAAPPFLGDGLLRYKRSFGAEVVPMSPPMHIAMRILRSTPAVIGSLQRSPPICLRDGRLTAVSFAPSDELATRGVEGPVAIDQTTTAGPW